MDFSGDLSILEPATLFQLFNMSRLTGMLKFITKDNNASFYFKEGELIYATIDTRRKKIGRFLIEKEWITEEQLNEALGEFTSKGGNERIGHILIDKGYLDYDSLATVIQEQMKEVVYDVLPWKQGQFIFFNEVQPKDEDILIDIKMDHLILEGLKRLDELKSD